ncbi:hypothetical protein [Nostoc sp.]|uniref:hypothetical protein n=1 Tax=Nostoc sp. TaxID=1180 RepID=UPI003FA5892F
MDAEAALAWLDAIIPPQTGEQLRDLQKVILVQVWLGRKYLDIAHSYGCTEGHAKDAGSQLWDFQEINYPILWGGQLARL